MKPSLLMCPPDHFGLEYEINPWMKLSRQPERHLAQEQWSALYRFLRDDLGLAVELIEAAPGLPDMVFTANAGLVRGREVVLGSFRPPQRRAESPLFEAWFKQRGYSILTLPPDQAFEGEGDALPAGPGEVWAGYLTRSDVRSHALVSRLLDLHLTSLELVDPRFYHLDTCFSPLGDGSLVYFPGAFDDYGRQAIEAGFSDLIAVPEEEAVQFVCNALVAGRHYVQPWGGGRFLRPALEARGFEVHQFDLSEFIKAGGAAKCLVLRLDWPE